jgi:hypothetical protein
MADNFDDNAVVAHLRKIYYGAEDATSSDLWSFYKDQFAKQSPAGRHSDLLSIDNYLAEYGMSATRETADLISKKRELADLHGILTRAGR